MLLVAAGCYSPAGMLHGWRRALAAGAERILSAGAALGDTALRKAGASMLIGHGLLGRTARTVANVTNDYVEDLRAFAVDGLAVDGLIPGGSGFRKCWSHRWRPRRT